jgi:hypothetical protein
MWVFDWNFWCWTYRLPEKVRHEVIEVNFKTRRVVSVSSV